MMARPWLQSVDTAAAQSSSCVPMRFRRSPRRPPAAQPSYDDHSGCPSCGTRPGGAAPILTCPGCGTASDIVPKAIGAHTLRDGTQARACTGCEDVTIVIEPDMVCESCQQVRPDVNDRMRTRYAEHGPGNLAEAPCVGCGYYVNSPDPPSPALDLLIDCQGCGDQIAIPQDDIPVGQGLQLSCGRCSTVTVVPRSVWCPHCGQHLRRQGIPELIRDATREQG
jgi:hypothetical protein